MGLRTDVFDLGRLELASGEGRRLDLEVELEPFTLAGQSYAAEPAQIPVRLDVSRMTHSGFALRLRFEARLAGPCMRCLAAAAPSLAIDAHEVSQPGEGKELESPYVRDGELELAAWAHDALALALPAQLLCREDCAGLCAVCGADLNEAGEHSHEAVPDPRWAKLRELKLD